jgi:hypothetical protein
VRELRIHAYCDACMAEGGRVEVNPEVVVTVALREAEPRRTVDLCGKHITLLLDPLRLLLGEPVEGRDDDEAVPAVVITERRSAIPERDADDLSCPLCEADLTTRPNLVRHLEERHDIARPAQPARCPACKYENEEPNRMTAHRTRAHAYRVLDEMLAVIPSVG